MNSSWTGAVVIIVSVGSLYHLCPVMEGEFVTNLDPEYG
jgi:hypothetical protein